MKPIFESADPDARKVGTSIDVSAWKLRRCEYASAVVRTWHRGRDTPTTKSPNNNGLNGMRTNRFSLRV